MVSRPLEDKRFFDTLHKYLKRHIPPPELCEMCNKVPARQLSNKTGIYNRDFENWWYLCVKCHYHFDIETRNIPTRKGLKTSDETKEKQRKSHIGLLKGRKATEETRRILSEAHQHCRCHHPKDLSPAWNIPDR